MSPQDIEADILRDLEELDDPISQYSYLLSCAHSCRPYPEQLRRADDLVRECQADTWVHVDWRDGRCVFDGDSESLLVRGALALLQEIFDGKERDELRGYRCALPDRPAFSRHFTREQLRGLRAILGTLEGDDCR